MNHNPGTTKFWEEQLADIDFSGLPGEGTWDPLSVYCDGSNDDLEVSFSLSNIFDQNIRDGSFNIDVFLDYVKNNYKVGHYELIKATNNDFIAFLLSEEIIESAIKTDSLSDQKIIQSSKMRLSYLSRDNIDLLVFTSKEELEKPPSYLVFDRAANIIYFCYIDDQNKSRVTVYYNKYTPTPTFQQVNIDLKNALADFYK